jgi:plasmid stability protein
MVKRYKEDYRNGKVKIIKRAKTKHRTTEKEAKAILDSQLLNYLRKIV